MYLIVDAIAVHNAGFCEGSGPIFLDDLMCTGDEASLLECARGSDINASDCAHREDAGVRCQGKPIYFFQLLTAVSSTKCVFMLRIYIYYTHTLWKRFCNQQKFVKNISHGKNLHNFIMTTDAAIAPKLYTCHAPRAT